MFAHIHTHKYTHTDSIWKAPGNDRCQFSVAITFGEELEHQHTDVSWKKATGQLGGEFSNDDDSVCMHFTI